MPSAPTVLVLAAGQGTRMRSHTPKVLHEICGRPMVLWPVFAALEAGAGKVIVVDSPSKALEDVLPEGVELAIQEHPNGTGGAVIAASSQIEEGSSSVVVLSGDVPLVSPQAIRELVDAHEQGGAGATMASTILEDPTGYGRVVRDEGGALLRVVETKREGDATPEELLIDEVNTGIYVFATPALLGALPLLSSENAQGELYLPQALDLIARGGMPVLVHTVAEEGLVLGINDGVALSQVRAIAQREINERHMRAGVSIIDPRATYIDVGVEIGPDARIEPGSTLKGSTRVGARATVGPHTTLIDSDIGEGSRVRISWLEGAALEGEVSVGPFAYLRPGTLLRAGSKIGTFVEVKNSDIGPHTKIPHLSYIGDADVGESSNLGAGTITANYDGEAKHRTTIGSNVKGGVDTSLVAPVQVGDGAFTGAGSVITEDVPPGALGISRPPQKNVEDHQQKRRRRRQG